MVQEKGRGELRNDRGWKGRVAIERRRVKSFIGLEGLSKLGDTVSLLSGQEQ